ncbi:MAG: protein kinase [Oscillospiraceae bacterium]
MEQNGMQRALNGRYELTRQVSSCGETVVYMGRDLVDQTQLEIREFFASAIMRREENGSVSVLAGCEVQYKSLASDFEELYEYLAGLGADSVLFRPFDILRQYNTVYAVSRYLPMETLDDFLARQQQMNWPELKRALAPVVAAIVRMHANGIYHRGISPETLLVGERESFLLSGFCIPAARTAGSEIDSTLYFGYSAPEQYSSNSWQGSWTDVYSIAAVCYRALTGTTPVEWRQRGQGRELTSAKSVASQIPENVSNALMTALSVDIRNRYRTVDEFWAALLHGPGEGTMTYQLPIQKRSESAIRISSTYRQYWRTALLAVGIILLVILLSLRSIKLLIGPGDSSESNVDSMMQAGSSYPSSSDMPSTLHQPGIVVPDLVDMSIEKVLVDPLFLQLFTFRPKMIFSETAPAGVIVRQEPRVGATLNDSDNLITLWVSKGSERTTMPHVLDQTIEEAALLLEGQEIRYVIEEVVDLSVTDGTVIWASRENDSILYRTTDMVTLRVGRHSLTPAASGDASGGSMPMIAEQNS